MFLLAIDTSGKNGTLALTQVAKGKPDVDIVEAVPLAGGTFSAQLVPQIAALLAKHGHTKSDLSAFAVVSGPGSFTGLRVGLAAIKALAEILQKPIASVSLLESLALAGGIQGRVIATLDAGRGDVYAGEYEIAGDTATLIHEQVQTKEELLVIAQQSAPGASIVTSDPTLAETMNAAAIPVTLVDVLHAGSIAALGWRKIQAGKIVTPENLEANYIRRSDAEILHKMKENTGH